MESRVWRALVVVAVVLALLAGLFGVLLPKAPPVAVEPQFGETSRRFLTYLSELTVATTTTLNGPTTINDSLEVTGTLDLGGAVELDDDVDIGGDLAVTGATELNDAVTVNNNAEITGTLDVDGAVGLADDLGVAGDLAVDGDGVITGTLGVDGGRAMVTSLVTNGVGITNSVTGASNALVFEGATADAYQINLTAADATSSDKNITLPNLQGEVMVSPGYDVAGGWFAAGQDFKYEGSTANEHEAMFRAPGDPVADAIYSLPAYSGYVAMNSADNVKLGAEILRLRPAEGIAGLRSG